MMSNVSKGNVLTVEVSWSSLIQGMFSRSLSGVYIWGPVPVVVMSFDASLRLLWHWRQMLKVEAEVRCSGILRASVM